MLKFLKKRSQQKPKDSEDIYSWKYLDVNDLDQIPNAIEDIYKSKYIGVIIRNVFSKQEVQAMKAGVEKLNPADMVSTGVGYSYPRIFAQLVRPHDGTKVDEADIKKYFDDCEKLPHEMSQVLGLDFKARIESVFNQISGPRKAKVASGYDGEGKYAFTSIRINLAEKGFIPVHCGNYFQQEFPTFYEHLRQEVNIKDQLSYFVTVNPAEEGGELTLFDLLWEAGQKKENTADDRGVSCPNGEYVEMGPDSPIKRQKVKPMAGDLLIFSGGPTWHKVEQVKGREDRITIGGFLAWSNKEGHLNYWT